MDALFQNLSGEISSILGLSQFLLSAGRSGFWQKLIENYTNYTYVIYDELMSLTSIWYKPFGLYI